MTYNEGIVCEECKVGLAVYTYGGKRVCLVCAKTMVKNVQPACTPEERKEILDKEYGRSG